MGIYLSPNGDDSNPGTESNPFASIERAMEEVRTLKSDGDFPEAGITVWFREGEYRITESIKMNREDSGSDEAVGFVQIKSNYNET